MYQNIILFYSWVILHCMDIHILFIHSLVDKTFGLFVMIIMAFGYCEYWCSEHLSTSFVWTKVFISLGCIPRSEIAGSDGNFSLTFTWMPNYFPKQLHHFILLPAMFEVPLHILIKTHLYLIIAILVGFTLWFWLAFP